MKLKKITCVKYGNYFINVDNITFISCGETNQETDGTESHQIYIHFSGGVESTMLYVSNIEESMKALNT
ncbi:MAG: hypothetical protein COB02_15745 [Candidatus Cloacimonadota bacterium]|nr:MAG: hypothetical protein COB02_15745 [Candidatus Cloacimonadota bacterium]